MRRSLAPMLFDEPDPTAREAQRTSPVVKAEPSPAAQRKAARKRTDPADGRSEEHTSELQSQSNLVCRLLLEKKKITHVADTSPPLAAATLFQRWFAVNPPTRQRANSHTRLHNRTPNSTALPPGEARLHGLYR